MTPSDLVLSRLPHARRSGSGWRCACPCHDGKSDDSLSIDTGEDGRVLLTCFSGCTAEDVVGAIGLQLKDLMAENGTVHRRHGTAMRRPTQQRKPRTVYPTLDTAIAALGRHRGERIGLWPYPDLNGEVETAAVRWLKPGGRKDHLYVSRCENGWTVGAMQGPRLLFNLPTLNDAEVVVISEGEKTATLMEQLGFVSTASSHGCRAAAKADWRPLCGKEVWIFPDVGKDGMHYAHEVARILHALDPSTVVRIIILPGLEDDGDDIEQFIENHDSLDLDDIKRLIEHIARETAPVEPDRPEPTVKPNQTTVEYDRATVECPAISPVIVRMCDVKSEPIRWLWRDRFAVGKLTLLAGDPGLGKSLVTLDMTARLSRGTPWPDALDEPVPVGGTVLLSAEDDPADTVRPRLDAAGADVSRIVSLTAVKRHDHDGDILDSFDLSSDLFALELAIDQTPDCRLVVIDPITAFLGHTDNHKNAELRGLLAPLAELAQRRRVAVVAVTHLRKGEGLAIYRAMGSLAFVAAARAAWGVVKDKQDPRRRLMLPIKNNLAPDVQGLAYTIEGTGSLDAPALLWSDEPVTIDVDEAMTPPKRGEQPVDLEEWLELHGGSVTISELARSGPRQFRGQQDAAKDALDALVMAGVCRRSDPKPGKRGGKPSVRYTLVSEWNGYDTPNNDSATGGIVSTPVKVGGGYDTDDHDPDRPTSISASTPNNPPERPTPGEPDDDPGPSGDTPGSGFTGSLTTPPAEVDGEWRPVPDDVPTTRESI